jgi:hypothetical protein
VLLLRFGFAVRLVALGFLLDVLLRVADPERLAVLVFGLVSAIPILPG